MNDENINNQQIVAEWQASANYSWIIIIDSLGL